jgi:hypothetical protein
MLLLAKLALGMTATVAVAGVYTFHDGIVRVDVDEFRAGGSHVHVWAPAAIAPMALHFVPLNHIEDATEKIGPMMPTIRVLIKELKKYPDAEFVDVRDHRDHVRVAVHNGKVIVDVNGPGETVHVACPLAAIEDAAGVLASRNSGLEPTI